MSVNAIGLTNGNVAQLAQEIASAIDSNNDGQVTTGEFASFLEDVLGSSSGLEGLAASAAHANPSSVALASEIAPSTWTGDSSPYGVTFAGFSQMNHNDLSLQDLAKSGNEKYLAYNYLLSNQIAADKTWAPAAAAALNEQRGANIFQAIDGETLFYGDEYIHTAPNGFGLAQGTYDPKAVSEFLWGYV